MPESRLSCCLQRRGVGRGRGHEHEEQPEQERPQGDAVGTGDDVLLRRRRAPPWRNRVARDRDRAALPRLGTLEAAARAQRHGLGRSAVEAPRPGGHGLIILPQRAGTGGCHRSSFFWPAGLADGLAPKESRYVGKHPEDSPQAVRPYGSPAPLYRGASAGWTAACYQGSRAAGRKTPAQSGIDTSAAILAAF